MKNTLIRILTGLTLTLCVLSSHAQSNDELSAWQSAGQIPLPDEVEMDPNIQFRFIDNSLLVASPGLQTGACGQLLVFEQNPNSRFELIQTLTAADFNQTCDVADGFGFSFSFGQDALFIGAPGQVLASSNMLPDGAVFVYSRDSLGFTPEQVIVGSGEVGNRAWGTRVETDGDRLLVQGNERGDESTIQGFANPRSVNLLEPDSGEIWQSARVFTDNQSTLYGQDFGVTESAVFIAKHTFVDIFSFGNIRNLPRFDSTLEIYNIDASNNNAVSAGVSQVIDSENVIFDSLETISSTNYIILERRNIVLYFSGHNDPEFTNASRITSYGSFRLRNGEWVSGRTSRNTDPMNINRLDFGDSLTAGNMQFGPDNTFFLNKVFRGPLNLNVREGFTLIQQEQFLKTNGLSTSAHRPVLVNNNNNQLVIIDAENDRITLNAFTTIPALDPAVTQAWWFGPGNDGQGVTLEVLSNNRLLMHWFTYDLSGNQMWVRGVGQLDNGVINMQLVRARGPSFTFGQFDPQDRVVEPWGQASIRFDDCRNGMLNYQSSEFGSGELPLIPLVNNGLDCNTGFIAESTFDVLSAPTIAGSFFDPARGGEGIILMPIPSTRELDEDGRPGSRILSRAVGFWLTYTPTGEQAWYYLGVYQRCPRQPISAQPTCRLEATGQPRSTMGPVFGPAYDPNARVTVPWGTASRFESGFTPSQNIFMPSVNASLFLQVDNPDGSGVLVLERASSPIGYPQGPSGW